jgi:hypothetical protein
LRRSRRKAKGSRATIPRKAIFVFLGFLLASGILLLGYAGVAHWILSGRRLRTWINTTPATSLLDYDEAVSTWPGRFRVRNLRIRGSDPNVEWIVVLEEARVDYSLAALLTRTFRVDRVRGSGLRFRLREKLDPTSASQPPRFLPPIPGFPDPPVREPAPEAPAQDGHPWTIDIRGLSIDRFDEIWMDTYRFQGHARLQGRFLLRSGELARVGPATIDFADGRVTLGSDDIARALSGRLQAAIAEWDPRRLRGAAVLRNVGATLHLRGECDDIGFLNQYFRPSNPHLEGGRGSLTFGGDVEKGVGSGVAELTTRGAKGRVTGVELNGDVRAALRISHWDLERGSMDLSGSSLAFSNVVAPGSGAARGWWGRFTLPNARFHDGLLALVNVQCRDARPLLAVLGVNLPHWTQGLLELDRLIATATVSLAKAKTLVRELDAQGGDFRILGEYEVVADRGRGVFLIDTGALNVGVEIGGGVPSLHLIRAREWFAKERALVADANREPPTAPKVVR